MGFRQYQRSRWVLRIGQFPNEARHYRLGRMGRIYYVNFHRYAVSITRSQAF